MKIFEGYQYTDAIKYYEYLMIRYVKAGLGYPMDKFRYFTVDFIDSVIELVRFYYKIEPREWHDSETDIRTEYDYLIFLSSKILLYEEGTEKGIGFGKFKKKQKGLKEWKQI